jgi:AcrR family transcriptional regulator
MSVPGVYHHYASKQELLVQILDLTMDQLEARTSSAVAQGHDPLERLSLLVEALALFHTMCSDLAFIGASEMRSLEQPHFDRIARRRTALQHLIDAHIDAAIVAGQASTSMPREAGRAIATMCTSLPQWFSKGGPTSPEEIAREYARLAVRMVGGEPR